jgi:hypothetical protein
MLHIEHAIVAIDCQPPAAANYRATVDFLTLDGLLTTSQTMQGLVAEIATCVMQWELAAIECLIA